MRSPRISFIGGVYHVVSRCNNREFLFKDDYDFLTFLQILLIAKVTYNVEVYAYCLTHNHYHLIIGTPYEDNLSAFMQYVNGNFAKAYNKRHGRTGRFWGGRFYSTVIESEEQFYKTLYYIELNMTRNGATIHPDDWKFSSYRAHANGKKDPIVDFHPLYIALSDDPKQRQRIYRDMIENYMLDKGMVKQPDLTRGLILGTPEFVQEILTEKVKDVPFYQKRKIYFCDDNKSCSLYKTNSPLIE